MKDSAESAQIFTVDRKWFCYCMNTFSALYLEVNWVRLDLLRLGTKKGIRFLSMKASAESAQILTVDRKCSCE